MMKILIIEDDAELAAAMAEYLELQGATCDFAYNGSSGVKLAKESRFDVVILDLNLPLLNGFGVVETLRKVGSSTPILMLTSSDIEQDQLTGFEVGIDDYVIKPSPMPVLWARLKSIVNRTSIKKESLTIGELKISFKQHKVERINQLIKLTPTEWKILSFLAIRFPEVVKRSEIEQHLWSDSGFNVAQGKLNVHLHGLRKAVDKPFDFAMIETVVNVGIRLTTVKTF